MESQRRVQALGTLAWMAGMAMVWPLVYVTARSASYELWWLIHPVHNLVVGEPVTDPVLLIQIAALASLTRFVFGFATTWLAGTLKAPRIIWVVALVLTILISSLNGLYLLVPTSTVGYSAAAFWLPDTAMVVGAWLGTRRRSATDAPLPSGTASANAS